jgi:hypothetical protein
MFDPFAGHPTDSEAVAHLRQLWNEKRLHYFHYPVIPSIRYGWGKPAHPLFTALFERHREQIANRLKGYCSLVDLLRGVARESKRGPHWKNRLLPVIDAVSIVGMIREFGPRRFVEVGSGSSTQFAHLAVRAFAPGCSITSIDPYPTAGVERFADNLLRQSLHSVDLAVFSKLEEGDILWIDGSHIAYSGSDVAVAMLEIVPRLARRVVIGIHDIPLPWDYPPGMANLMFSELHVVAAYLLGIANTIEILLPCFYANVVEKSLRDIMAPIWALTNLQDLQETDGGGAFWFLHK